MVSLLLSNIQSSAKADGQSRILENVESENAELRDKAVELMLQIQALRDGRTPDAAVQHPEVPHRSERGKLRSRYTPFSGLSRHRRCPPHL